MANTPRCDTLSSFKTDQIQSCLLAYPLHCCRFEVLVIMRCVQMALACQPVHSLPDGWHRELAIQLCYYLHNHKQIMMFEAQFLQQLL